MDRLTTTDKVEAVKSLKKRDYPIKRACKTLNISRSTYYYQLKQEKTKETSKSSIYSGIPAFDKNGNKVPEQKVIDLVKKYTSKYPYYGYRMITNIHGGPFANIAHGCNSVAATKLAMKTSDITVTEAGFGADLGAEKFLDIKCRFADIKPDAVVIVATARALKMHGGMEEASIEELAEENVEAIEAGFENLAKHIENITEVFNLPAVVAINRFPTDTEAELDKIRELCEKKGVNVALSEIFAKGGEGGQELAEKVLDAMEEGNEDFDYLYPAEMPIDEKIEAIAKKVYGADGVVFTASAEKDIERLTEQGFADMPICMAKTQSSISDDASKKGRPTDFEITVREINVSAGAGFLVALTGAVMTMPGLPKVPSAEEIDVDSDGNITGLF